MRIVNLLSDEEIKSLDIQRCPRCRHGFIKDGGCPSVQCFQCKLAFSWEYIQPSNTSTVSQKNSQNIITSLIKNISRASGNKIQNEQHFQ